MHAMLRLSICAAIAALILGGCGSSGHDSTHSTTSRSAGHPRAAVAASNGRAPVNVYRADFAGDLSPTVRGDPALVYVPNSMSNTVDVISQRTMKVVEQFATGAL